MTLILTELSQAGIAMAADSAISYYEPNGNIKHVDHKGWKKLLWVPRIRAGVSYWGFVGKVVSQRFDEWLEDRIASQNYRDLRNFADFLADELNSKCRNQPLDSNECVGIHVAGYHSWEDNVRRPTFYHVHNGHGHILYQGTVAVAARGMNGQPIQRLLPTNPTWVWAPRGLFQVNDDFPNHNRSPADNLAMFSGGPYLTRNGDIGHYILIGDALQEVSDQGRQHSTSAARFRELSAAG